MINITSVNYLLEDNGILNIKLDDDDTLLDSDLVILNPVEYSTLWLNKTRLENDGIKRVDSPNSDYIRKIFLSRKKEIDTLLENGKVIVVFLNPVRVVAGEKGDTGNYSYISNYDFMPISKDYLIKNLEIGKSSSPNSIILKDLKNYFTPYYSAFKDEIKYNVYFDIDTEENEHTFLANRSNKSVGFIWEIHNGLMVFLPSPEYQKNNKKLVGTLTQCAKKFLLKHEITPPPIWINSYTLPGEDELQKDIEDLQSQVDRIEEKKKEVVEEKNKISYYKKLLYEQGTELELVVIDAFKLFGFNAENRKIDDLEHDIIFNSDKGRGIAEIEGKDNDAIHISKLDQLNRVVDEDFKEVGNFAQGLLIGNHYRFKVPKDRENPFTDKVLIFAKKKNFGLLTTFEIFKAVEQILGNPEDEKLKESFRTKILKTEGEIITLV